MSEMTATRMRWGTVVAGALLWLAAAWLLWRTTIPGDLATPDLDPRGAFPAAELREAARYERVLRASWLLSTLASLAALVVLARRAPRLARATGLGRVGSAVIVGSVTFAVLWAVALPFSIVDWWWQRRHGLTTTALPEKLLEPWASLAASAVFGLVFVAVLVGIAGRYPRRWWAVVVPVFAVISVAFAVVQLLILPFATHPLDDERLRTQAQRLERALDVEGTPVEVEEVSGSTTQANAYAYRLGPLRRVVVWDTLLDGRFRDAEVRVVLAHELAHVARQHVLKWLAWLVLASIPLWWLVARITDRRGGLGDPGNLPYGLLVIALVSLAATPLGNAVSRRYEAEADWVALQTTRDPAAARGLFRRFSTTSLAQPEPPLWAYALLEDHPTLMQRIEMAEAWKRREAVR
jgi:STE24 endopeptidase